MRDKTEAKIQQEIYAYFNNTFCLKHHTPRCIIFSVPNDSSSKEETMRKAGNRHVTRSKRYDRYIPEHGCFRGGQN